MHLMHKRTLYRCVPSKNLWAVTRQILVYRRSLISNQAIILCILLCSDVPERRSKVSHVLAEPQPQGRLPRIQGPKSGAMNFLRRPLALRTAQVQPAGTRPTKSTSPDCILHWASCFATLRGGCMST